MAFETCGSSCFCPQLFLPAADCALSRMPKFLDLPDSGNAHCDANAWKMSSSMARPHKEVRNTFTASWRTSGGAQRSSSSSV